MERLKEIETSLGMVDRRLTIHETECTMLRKEIRNFMVEVKRLIRWAVGAAITGFISLLVWMFKESVHIHVGGIDLRHLWISLG